MRCANSESLFRHEREVAKAEEAYDKKCEAMFAEIDEHLQSLREIMLKYGLFQEGREYIDDEL